MKEQAKEDWEAMNSIMNQLIQELSQEKNQNKQFNTKQFITKEQDEVWLNLYIAYNCINREEMKNIEKRSTVITRSKI